MIRRSLVLGSLLALTLPVVACGGDHTEGVAAATVAEPVATAPAAPAPSAAREALTIDRASSSVGFTGAKITGSHDGSFSELGGSIQLDPSDLTASQVRVAVQMRSLAIEPARLSEHLLSPDFFDAAQFPEATFESTAIRAGGEGQIGGQPATHTVTGNLTMRGATRAITFPAVIEVQPSGVRARSELTVNRRDFGIVYPGMPDDLIRDEVVIRFDLRAPRAS